MVETDKSKLSAICEPVSIDDGLRIASELILELERHPNGVGLAAPQIGIAKRVFVIRSCYDTVTPFINPEIFEMRKPFIFENEGCLSFPNQFVDTIRYNKIKIKDEMGVLDFDGPRAVICQHELNHLDGKTMFDFMVPDAYDLCFCGSQKKFKFCCFKKVNAQNKKKSIKR